MIAKIAYFMVFGKPLIMYGGILTYVLFLSAAAIGIMNRRGISIIPFRWHARLAILAIVFATVHAIFGLSAYFGF